MLVEFAQFKESNDFHVVVMWVLYFSISLLNFFLEFQLILKSNPLWGVYKIMLFSVYILR